MSAVRKYGWQPDVPHPEDKKYPKAKLKALKATTPDTVDMRPQMPPVYDQKNLGSCTAQAACAALQFKEKVRLKFRKKRPIPARLFVYGNTRKLQGTFEEDSGAS